MARVNIFTAAAAGEAVAVQRMIRKDRSRVHAAHGREVIPPLAYACGSPLHKNGAQQGEGLRRVVALLLRAGASANSFSLFHAGEGEPARIPVLYYACVADHAALVQLLLEHGAKTQDGESIDHAAQLNRRVCLRALLRHGADLSSAQSPYGNTPLYFLAGHPDERNGRAAWFKGMAWLLDHGADPNIPSLKLAETPLHRIAAGAPKMRTARLLISHGADPCRRRADGRTPYALAMRHGNLAMAKLFLRYGAEAEVLPPEDALFAACHAADGAAARRVLASHPGLLELLSDDDRGAVADAAMRGNGRAVRLMAGLGFPLDWENTGATALHHAAWLGKAAMVKLLLQLGAPVNRRDRRFGSSPLGWAAHGSRFGGGPAKAYSAIVVMLLAAGAEREASLNRWSETPESMASKAVALLLRKRGFAL
ncbi:MAG: ankyrin repeat domain-containing protein [Terriglobales bacterium]